MICWPFDGISENVRGDSHDSLADKEEIEEETIHDVQNKTAATI